MNEINSNISTNGNKKFDLLSKESIKCIVDQNGLEGVTEEAVLLLSSDVTYRLREVVNNSIEFMRHSKRRRLTTSDINKALNWSDCEPVFGFEANPLPIETIYSKDANVFVSDDPLIDLNEEIINIFERKTPELKAFENEIRFSVEWISVDGKLDSNDDNSMNGDGYTEELEDYYQNVVKAILGTNNQTFVMTLKDLSTNCRITPVLPKLINFIMNGIKRLSHDISQLKRLLNTIESLFRNPSLFLSFESYLNGLIQSILHCIVEPLNPISDHWTLRDSASHLLVNVLNEWFTPFSGKNLKCFAFKCLCNCLNDSSKSFGCHYGAVKAFQSMEYEVIIQYLYPILNNYIKSHLLPAISDDYYTNDPQIRTDGLKVFGELLFIAELICLKMRSKLINSDLEKIDNSLAKFDFEVYSKLSDIFGDSLYARLPINFEKIRHTFFAERTNNFSKHETYLFETPESLQTGDQLLDAFYEAPAHTEEISELSATLDDDNSFDENSIMSDREKETTATDLHLIKSTIDDPTLGIKLTIKKLSRDSKRSEQNNKKSRSNRRNSWSSKESDFEYIPLKQTSIRFDISGTFK